MSHGDADLIARLLTEHPLEGDSRFQPISGSAADLGGVEVVPGAIYRYPQYDASSRAEPEVTLTVYLGLGGLGGRLWEQEARVLHRIGAMAHPALPRFLDGGQLEAGLELDGRRTTTGAGYIRTLRVGESAAGPNGGGGFSKRMHTDRPAALRHLWLLADGLAVLRDARIAHQNLWPGSLEVGADESGDLALRVTRFEMSTMVANLLRRATAGGSAEPVRHLYEQQDKHHLLYCPPERLAFLFATPGHRNTVGGLEGDVFSLGTMAAEWFLGPELPAPEGFDYEAVRELQERRRSAINASVAVPRTLRALLYDMTDPDPRGRPTMAEVCRRIDESYEATRTELAGVHDAQPHVVAYMANHSDRTLLTWGYLTASTKFPEGQDEISELIERDMRGAQVLHSPTGAVGFVASSSGDPASRQRANTVVVGRQFVWFLSVLERQTAGALVEVPHARVIRYVLQRERADRNPRLDELRMVGLRRELFAVEVIEAFTTSQGKLDRLARSAGDWSELERIDTRPRLTSTAGESYLRVLTWYLEFQRAQLDARSYAFTRPEVGTQRVELRADHDRERSRRAGGRTVTRKFLANPRLRVSMADHFEEAAADAGGWAELEILSDQDGAPGGKVGTARFIEVRATESIIVERRTGTLPANGWVRLESDRSSRTSIDRQLTAVSELGGSRLLLQQLVRPTSGKTLTERWEGAGQSLQGQGRDAVREILSHETMFALQGPPGTGKTEVTSSAVAEYLGADRGARVLVSAQSHDALDNLALRILRKLGVVGADGRPVHSNYLALRSFSEFTRESVAESMKPFELSEVVARLMRQAAAQTQEWLTTRRVENPALAQVLQRWLASIEGTKLDVTARVRRGASLVFATTGAATYRRLVEEYGAAEPFDWVVVEEAAKAWPTELALPLVRGLRWTLVGDQAQIGAFNRQQVERFLLDCRDDPDPEIATWYEQRDEFIRVFDTFGNLVAQPTGPRMELTEQYRMNADIAEVVSEGFYTQRLAGGLRTMREDEPHGLVEPAGFADASLVWIDTRDAQRAEGYWSNEWEADVVAKLVRDLRPEPRSADGRSIAILTPYRQQQAVLRGRLSEYASAIHTIDAFQGREADIVVVSLVRDRDPLPGRPTASIGHLADPARANVMFSRARQLLVVVGRSALYVNTGVAEWDAAMRTIADRATVIAADKAMRG
jgi:hypothetical protein